MGERRQLKPVEGATRSAVPVNVHNGRLVNAAGPRTRSNKADKVQAFVEKHKARTWLEGGCRWFSVPGHGVFRKGVSVEAGVYKGIDLDRNEIVELAPIEKKPAVTREEASKVGGEETAAQVAQRRLYSAALEFPWDYEAPIWWYEVAIHGKDASGRMLPQQHVEEAYVLLCARAHGFAEFGLGTAKTILRRVDPEAQGGHMSLVAASRVISTGYHVGADIVTLIRLAGSAGKNYAHYWPAKTSTADVSLYRSQWELLGINTERCVVEQEDHVARLWPAFNS